MFPTVSSKALAAGALAVCGYAISEASAIKVSIPYPSIVTYKLPTPSVSANYEHSHTATAATVTKTASANVLEDHPVADPVGSSPSGGFGGSDEESNLGDLAYGNDNSPVGTSPDSSYGSSYGDGYDLGYGSSFGDGSGGHPPYAAGKEASGQPVPGPRMKKGTDINNVRQPDEGARINRLAEQATSGKAPPQLESDWESTDVTYRGDEKEVWGVTEGGTRKLDSGFSPSIGGTGTDPGKALKTLDRAKKVWKHFFGNSSSAQAAQAAPAQAPAVQAEQMVKSAGKAPSRAERMGHPSRPVHPGSPGYTARPRRPSYPNYPGHPGIPGHPGNPFMPGVPGVPGIPAIPGRAGRAGRPGRLGRPGRPVQLKARDIPLPGKTWAHTWTSTSGEMHTATSTASYDGHSESYEHDYGYEEVPEDEDPYYDEENNMVIPEDDGVFENNE